MIGHKLLLISFGKKANFLIDIHIYDLAHSSRPPPPLVPTNVARNPTYYRNRRSCKYSPSTIWFSIVTTMSIICYTPYQTNDPYSPPRLLFSHCLRLTRALR